MNRKLYNGTEKMILSIIDSISKKIWTDERFKVYLRNAQKIDFMTALKI